MPRYLVEDKQLKPLMILEAADATDATLWAARNVQGEYMMGAAPSWLDNPEASASDVQLDERARAAFRTLGMAEHGRGGQGASRQERVKSAWRTLGLSESAATEEAKSAAIPVVKVPRQAGAPLQERQGSKPATKAPAKLYAKPATKVTLQEGAPRQLVEVTGEGRLGKILLTGRGK